MSEPIIPFDARFTRDDFTEALRRAYASMNVLAQLGQLVRDHINGYGGFDRDQFETMAKEMLDVDEDLDLRLNLMDAWLLCCDKPFTYGPMVSECSEMFLAVHDSIEKIREENNAFILFELEANSADPALVEEIREEADDAFLLPSEVDEWVKEWEAS